jgi:hypothetical protein
MTEYKALSSDEKRRLRISFTIMGASFILFIMLLFTNNIGLAVLSIVIFISVGVYTLVNLDRDVHLFEIFDIGSDESQENMRQQLEDRRKANTPSTLDDIENTNLANQVSDRMAEGWTIENVDNSSNRVVMSSTKGGNFAGHAVTGFLTGFWTFGTGNIVYNELSKKRNMERIAVSLENSSTDKDTSNKEREGVALLKTLNNLKQEEAITEEEFEEKKKEILERI